MLLGPFAPRVALLDKTHDNFSTQAISSLWPSSDSQEVSLYLLSQNHRTSQDSFDTITVALASTLLIL
jgi:hypothetical protein